MPEAFDIQKAFDDILETTKDIGGRGGSQAKKVAAVFLKNRKERLALLAELRIAGDLPDDKFKSRLADEKLILEAELNALAVMSKSTAQQAAQSALDIFQLAVAKALPDILKIEPPQTR